ncbi:MAG: hypothetical protein HRU20_14355 [Pseudomonadales bacterium]|nr:hypothetical protein [Pseudomonadales bacterium]
MKGMLGVSRFFFVFFLSMAAYGGIDVIDASISKSYALTTEKTIKPELSILSVDLKTLTFEQGSTLAIAKLVNHNSVELTPKVGIALYDENNNLLAVAESKKYAVLSKSRIKPGKETKLKFDFSTHLNNFDQVKTVHIVFSIVLKTEKSTARPWDNLTN